MHRRFVSSLMSAGTQKGKVKNLNRAITKRAIRHKIVMYIIRKYNLRAFLKKTRQPKTFRNSSVSFQTLGPTYLILDLHISIDH